jgi:hypothetical protein
MTFVLANHPEGVVGVIDGVKVKDCNRSRSRSRNRNRDHVRQHLSASEQDGRLDVPSGARGRGANREYPV